MCEKDYRTQNENSKGDITMSEELKKVDEMVALSDEDLDGVAGGYSKETWKTMTYEERVRAKEVSDAYRTLGIPCDMDNPDL